MSHPPDCDKVKVKSDNHFNTTQKPFPPLVDGKICTAAFIDAARGVVTIVEKLGSFISPVKSDMNGNIEKIWTRYRSDPIKNKTIHELVLSEQEEGCNLATDGLLWFNRALHFIECFLEQLFSSNDGSNSSEDLQKELTHAYTCSLKQYHGWMIQKVFIVICKLCPRRTQFIKSLGEVTDLPGFYEDLSAFLQTLKTNRMEIHGFLDAHNLNSNYCV